MDRNRAQLLLSDQAGIAEMLNDCSINRVYAIDLNWHVIAWNRTSELISGINRQELLGKPLLDLFPQILRDQEMLDAITAAFQGKKSFLPSNNTGFNRVYSENHFIPLLDNSGIVIGVMNIMHDVSHRIKIEKQLQKLNIELRKKYNQIEKANKELATFTYFTGRDIKEPLKHVYTSLELLVKKEASALSNMSKGNLRRVQGSLNKINLLLDDILTVSGISGNNEAMEMVNLNEVLDFAKFKLKDKLFEKKAIVESGPLPSIPGYRKMLEYFFVNMIENGIKFQPEENIPRVQISTQKISGDEAELNELAQEKEYYTISFIDNGIGFDQRDAERIFELFERLHERKYHGTGIGLTICKKISEAHDGYISVESAPGSGTNFNCYFPAENDDLTNE